MQQLVDHVSLLDEPIFLAREGGSLQVERQFGWTFTLSAAIWTLFRLELKERQSVSRVKALLDFLSLQRASRRRHASLLVSTQTPRLDRGPIERNLVFQCAAGVQMVKLETGVFRGVKFFGLNVLNYGRFVNET